jgi:hypothetical protein
MVSVYVKARDVRSAREVVRRHGSQGRVVSWNAMLTTYVRAADVVERRTCSRQCRPVKNVIPWTTMIRALSNAGDFTAHEGTVQSDA